MSVVIFAGGTGIRMGAELPKQFIEVGGKPILVHTIERFQQNGRVDDIVLVCRDGWIDHARELIARYGLSKAQWIVSGGDTGQLSIYAGLCELRKRFSSTKDVVVMIHDGVRPLIDKATIDDCIDCVIEHGSAVTIAPAVETVITLDEDNTIDRVVERGRCRMAKAPQCFWLDDILAAHDDAYTKGKHDYIDSASLMAAYEHAIVCVEGPDENIKITTPIDLRTFEAVYGIQMERHL